MFFLGVLARVGQPVSANLFETSFQNGLIYKRFDSNRFSKFQIYNFLYFLQFLCRIGHEESENHGPEALGIIIRDILALFLIKCGKKGKEYFF